MEEEIFDAETTFFDGGLCSERRLLCVVDLGDSAGAELEGSLHFEGTEEEATRGHRAGMMAGLTRGKSEGRRGRLETGGGQAGPRVSGRSPVFRKQKKHLFVSEASVVQFSSEARKERLCGPVVSPDCPIVEEESSQISVLSHTSRKKPEKNFLKLPFPY